MLKNTKALLKQYGHKILTGSMEDADILALYDSFRGKGDQRSEQPYNDEHYRPADAMEDFAQHLLPFISKQALFQLVSKLLAFERNRSQGQMLRNSSIAKTLFIYEAHISGLGRLAPGQDAMSYLETLQLPENVLHHYVHHILPCLIENNKTLSPDKIANMVAINFVFTIMQNVFALDAQTASAGEQSFSGLIDLQTLQGKNDSEQFKRIVASIYSQISTYHGTPQFSEPDYQLSFSLEAIALDGKPRRPPMRLTQPTDFQHSFSEPGDEVSQRLALGEQARKLMQSMLKEVITMLDTAVVAHREVLDKSLKEKLLFAFQGAPGLKAYNDLRRFLLLCREVINTIEQKMSVGYLLQALRYIVQKLQAFNTKIQEHKSEKYLQAIATAIPALIQHANSFEAKLLELSPSKGNRSSSGAAALPFFPAAASATAASSNTATATPKINPANPPAVKQQFLAELNTRLRTSGPGSGTGV